MPNIELSISPDYVGDWNLTAAVREIYQNALDQETLNPENELLFSYDPELRVLQIGNKTSSLNPSTLVLGKTTKNKNDALIGQFGEGYKLALVVLLRLGKAVTIYNNPSVWTPSIRHSDTFGTPILNINIVKYRFKELPTHDLIFKIAGVTPEEYEEIKGSNLHLHGEIESVPTDFGRILKGEEYKGKIFVHGLFISKIDKAHFVYDFKPGQVTVGRDRDLVNEWDLFYATSKMWAGIPSEDKTIEKMIQDKAPDVEHIDAYVWRLPKETITYIGGNWYETHGKNAYPVSNQKQADEARKLYGSGVNVIIVPANLLAILKETDQYKSFTSASITQQSPASLVRRMLKHPDRYKPSIYQELKALAAMAECWDWKRA